MNRSMRDYLSQTPNPNATTLMQRSAVGYQTPKSEQRQNLSLPQRIDTPIFNFGQGAMERSLNTAVNQARNTRINEEEENLLGDSRGYEEYFADNSIAVPAYENEERGNFIQPERAGIDLSDRFEENIFEGDLQFADSP